MIVLSYNKVPEEVISIDLPASKSLSNRFLILQALSRSKAILHNLSNANDTRIMQSLLQQSSNEYDVQDAGTVYRFLLPYLCLKPGIHHVRGTPRLMQRPIEPLIAALTQLGAVIDREEECIRIKGGFINGRRTSISQKHSSQFASALLLSAAAFPNGIELELQDEAVSEPYLQMTLSCLETADIIYTRNTNIISIAHQSIHLKNYTIENDWSSAAFIYQFAALLPNTIFRLSGLHKDSKQGDAQVQHLFNAFGVSTTYQNNNIVLQKRSASPLDNEFILDAIHIPDLVPSLAVTCAMLGVKAYFRNVHHLIYKESNRLEMLRLNLEACGAQVNYSDSTLSVISAPIQNRDIKITTAKDHRIAMAFAPLCISNRVIMDDETCVTKSFPSFWTELNKIGVSYESI
jgi:3-phosphoshikimate 1-carboxyvinyltransferase